MLSESQKKFIQSLSSFSVSAEISTFLFGRIKDIISNNFTMRYEFLLVTDIYSNQSSISINMIKWLIRFLEYNIRSLNSIVTIAKIDLDTDYVNLQYLLKGAGSGIFETIQHSDIYCEPRIMLSEDLTPSSSVFLNSKPDAIINLGI